VAPFGDGNALSSLDQSLRMPAGAHAKLDAVSPSGSGFPSSRIHNGDDIPWPILKT
jgi:hypothetical protein